MRGKCHFCLFDYKSAYIDITQCVEVHKTLNRLKAAASMREDESQNEKTVNGPHATTVQSMDAY